MYNNAKSEVSENENKWSFNIDDVVKNFQTIAKTNIPNYEVVIDKCIKIADTFLSKTSNIIDVGSSLGFTLKKFNNAGYINLYGVEKSKKMIENMLFKNATIFNSDVFPKELKFDMVLMNWVLHFILDRKKYLIDVFDSLNDGGIVILSEKIYSPKEFEKIYYEFKKENNISELEILEKKKKLQGVLITYPIEWYIETLKNIGFSDIQIIDADFCFNTLYARKYDCVSNF